MDDEPVVCEDLPVRVKAGIEKSLEQARNGQTKTYADVKKMLAKRIPKTNNL